MQAEDCSKQLEQLTARIAGWNVDMGQVKERMKALRIETPSWGYADSGTRFFVFRKPGAARTIYEKLEDAAQVNKMTGVTPSVAIHIPWDEQDEWTEVKSYAEKLGLSIGAVNPNLFQDDAYMLGSITNPDPGIRRKATDEILRCIDIMRKTGSSHLSLWLADGTNYPGQGDFRLRKRWMESALHEVYEHLDPGMQLLLEYKFYEPGFYHTDVADWGMATIMCQKLGQRAKTLVDLGHHPQGTNIEHIVAFLIDEGKLGGFHFNNRKYGDDDLTTGSINPYELFLIFVELVMGEDSTGEYGQVAYMIDQSHNLKPKVEAMIQSVEQIQIAHAKALLVDKERLSKARDRGNIIDAEMALVEAFNLDVTPLLIEVRREMGVPEDPLRAHRESGYYERIAAERR